MTVHEKPVGASVEWYTSKSLFDALGLEFDLDPASPCPAVPWVPARAHYCIDGEERPWDDWRVWLNPPYGPAGVPFIERMIEHDNGLLLIPARTETRAFQRAAKAARMVVFLRDRLHFVRPDGTQARAPFASALLAFGDDPDMLRAVVAADLGWTANRDACRERDEVCRSCGKTPEENGQALSVDHLIPWRLFADEIVANSLDNLVALCRVCHAKKTARAEQAYFRGDVLGWLVFLRDVGVDPASLVRFEEHLLPAGTVAA
jgi:hypothetical protein